jgi:mevalonate pyrophosphate decarboxylase
LVDKDLRQGGGSALDFKRNDVRNELSGASQFLAQRELSASQSEGMTVAVGFSPRFKAWESRRGATLESARQAIIPWFKRRSAT